MDRKQLVLLLLILVIIFSLGLAILFFSDNPRRIKEREDFQILSTASGHENTYLLTNIEVIDGDTVKADIHLGFGIIKHDSIRVNGVDAWERGDKPRGTVATKFTEDWVAKHKTIVLVTVLGNDIEKYGRALGKVKSGKDVLGDDLVNNGHAVYKEY